MTFKRRGKTLTQTLEELNKKILNAASKAVADTAQEYTVKYTEITVKWANKGKFSNKQARTKDMIKSVIEHRGPEKALNVLTWTDAGTKPHIIAPVRAPALSFLNSYDPFTKPIAKANVGTGKSSGSRVYAQVVNHPGTKARKFSETYAQEAVGVLREKLIAEIKRVT